MQPITFGEIVEKEWFKSENGWKEIAICITACKLSSLLLSTERIEEWLAYALELNGSSFPSYAELL